MKIGLFTDGLLHLGFTEALAKAAKLGVQSIEIGTGNFSPAPHCDLSRLLESSAAREEFMHAIRSCNLELAALNCSGNPLHPNHDLATRLVGFFEWSREAIDRSSKDLDTLAVSAELLRVRLKGRRRNSRLPALVDLLLSRPLVSVPMAAKDALNGK